MACRGFVAMLCELALEQGGTEMGNDTPNVIDIRLTRTGSTRP